MSKREAKRVVAPEDKGPCYNVGDVYRLRSARVVINGDGFTAYTTLRATKKRAIVVLVIGDDHDDGEQIDVNRALMAAGWTPPKGANDEQA